jgi:hypothetical protein
MAIFQAATSEANKTPQRIASIKYFSLALEIFGD